MKPVAAVVQMTSGDVVADNLAEAGRWLAAAKAGGAILAVLPENFALMPRNDAARRAAAEQEGQGPIQDFLAETAARLGLWVVGGTLPVSVPGDPRPAACCPVYDATGNRVARYDKMHLFDVDLPGRDERYRESDHIAPGSKVVVIDSPLGRLGLSVCYDMRFPELYREMVIAGAEVFTVPAAFTAPTGRAHWEVLLRARAIENLAFVLAPAQGGIHPNGRETYGDSLIIDPWGRVLARRPRGAGVVLAALDREAQQATRVSFPCLQNRVLSRSPSC
jgi:predicted amidohydrolase